MTPKPINENNTIVELLHDAWDTINNLLEGCPDENSAEYLKRQMAGVKSAIKLIQFNEELVREQYLKDNPL